MAIDWYKRTHSTYEVGSLELSMFIAITCIAQNS